jgi:hypothetical protein
MADEEKVSAEAKKPEPPPPTFTVTNVVRRQRTRVRRVAAPGKRRFKQYICGRRLLRNQSMRLTMEEVEANRERLYELVREGAIEIEAPDGSKLIADIHGNLMTRKGMEVHPVGEPPPKPKAPVAKPDLPEPPPAPPPPQEEPEPEPEAKADDLTELPGVGPGRVKKLTAAGVTTFKQVAEMPPGDLAKILGSPVTVDQAADICDAASEREEA